MYLVLYFSPHPSMKQKCRDLGAAILRGTCPNHLHSNHLICFMSRCFAGRGREAHPKVQHNHQPPAPTPFILPPRHLRIPPQTPLVKFGALEITPAAAVVAARTPCDTVVSSNSNCCCCEENELGDAAGQGAAAGRRLFFSSWEQNARRRRRVC